MNASDEYMIKYEDRKREKESLKHATLCEHRLFDVFKRYIHAHSITYPIRANAIEWNT